MQVLRYTDNDQEKWNQFVSESKTNSFLFNRSFVEYHKQRFQDYSLICVDDKTIEALLPANRVDTTVSSHGGLTYGGFITSKHMTAPKMLSLFENVAEFLRKDGVKRLVYKALPHIYHSFPAEEDLYALHRMGAKLSQRAVSTTIDYRNTINLQERRRRGKSKAEKAGFQWQEGSEFISQFWEILEKNLTARHNVKPVHTLEEITRLNKSFPKNVRQFVAAKDNNIHAGVLVFETQVCAHLQYISADEMGKDLGALDFLIAHLIEFYRGKIWYFDFGISTEQKGLILNNGLIEQKEGFGGRSVMYDIYELDL